MRRVALLSLGLWLGAILFFAIIAPQFFATLDHAPGGRVLAADIAGRSLARLHYLGLGLGIAFIVLATLARREAGRRKHSLSSAVGLAALMLALTALSQFYVSPKIRSLRSTAGIVSISELPDSDIRRATFERWHRSSTMLEGVVFTVGVVAFLFAARGRD